MNQNRVKLQLMPKARTAVAWSSQPESHRALAAAASLHLQGRTEDALQKLQEILSSEDLNNDVVYACGRLQEELGRFEDAFTSFQRYLKAVPASHGASFHAGLCLQQLSRWSESTAFLRTSLAEEPEDMDAAFSLAVSLIRDHQPAEALLHLETVLAVRPGDEQTLMAKAAGLHLLGEFDQAAECYNHVLALNPHSLEALNNALIVHRQLGDRETVRDFARLLLSLSADSETAHECMAWAAFQDQNDAEALEHCTRCTEINPQRFEYWSNLALCHQQAGRTSEAINAYRRASDLRPDAAQPHAQLGYLFQQSGEPDSAIAHYEEALRFAPEMVDVMLNLASLLEKSDLDQAEALYQRVTDLDPTVSDAALRLGVVRMRKGDLASAVNAFEACLMMRSDWPEARLNLALSLHQSGELDRARQLLDELIAAHPGNTDALRALATIALEQQDHENAFQLHLRLLESGGESAEVCYNAALLAREFDDLPKSQELFNRSLALDPEFPEALVNLGHVLNDLGQREPARDCWRRAVEMAPGLAVSYFYSE